MVHWALRLREARQVARGNAAHNHVVDALPHTQRVVAIRLVELEEWPSRSRLGHHFSLRQCFLQWRSATVVAAAAAAVAAERIVYDFSVFFRRGFLFRLHLGIGVVKRCFPCRCRGSICRFGNKPRSRIRGRERSGGGRSRFLALPQPHVSWPVAGYRRGRRRSCGFGNQSWDG